MLAAEPHDPYFLELKGQILLESGRPADAVAPLREAVRRTNQPLISVLLAHALIATEDPANFAEAEQVLRVAVQRDRENPFAWYQLGVVYERRGDTPRAALATAERYAMMGDHNLALRSADVAVQGLKPGTVDYLRAQDIAMGLNRVFDILDIEPDVTSKPNAQALGELRQEIRFENVSFAYEPERPVLQDVSFSVIPGTVTAIVGPTGSGKTSLMSLISRLFDPDSGSVSIDGVDLKDLDLESLRAGVSVALQENVLFGLSLRDNIRYAVPDAPDEQLMEAVRVACVEDYIASLPDGLDTMLSDRGGKLSTGQRQRLSIARALAKGAPILILDEPTAALDAATEHRVLQRLAEWANQRAVFLITHRISTIQQADKILYIDQGKLIEQGSHEELMSLEGGAYRAFVETESRLSQRPTAERNE